MTPAVKTDMQLAINGQASDLLQTGQTVVITTADGPVTLWFPEDYVRHSDDENDGPVLFITTPFLDVRVACWCCCRWTPLWLTVVHHRTVAQFKLYLESEGTPHLDWRVTIISEDMDFNELHGVLVRGVPEMPGNAHAGPCHRGRPSTGTACPSWQVWRVTMRWPTCWRPTSSLAPSAAPRLGPAAAWRLPGWLARLVARLALAFFETRHMT